jgi:hypothetical protein
LYFVPLSEAVSVSVLDMGFLCYITVEDPQSRGSRLEPRYFCTFSLVSLLNFL